MTPLETALRLMARRDDLGSPDFVLAYVAAEVERDPLAFATDRERSQAEWDAIVRRLRREVNAAARAYVQMGRAVTDYALAVTRAARTLKGSDFALAGPSEGGGA